VKFYEVPAYYGVFGKHCNFNTKLDPPPSVNGETPHVVALSLKVGGQIFENGYYSFKRGDKNLMFFMEILKEFNNVSTAGLCWA